MAPDPKKVQAGGAGEAGDHDGDVVKKYIRNKRDYDAIPSKVRLRQAVG